MRAEVETIKTIFTKVEIPDFLLLTLVNLIKKIHDWTIKRWTRPYRNFIKFEIGLMDIKAPVLQCFARESKIF